MQIPLSINGRTVSVSTGTTVAAAILTSGAPAFRPLCGMGICFECRATIDGESHCRTCQTECVPGMEVWIENGEFPNDHLLTRVAQVPSLMSQGSIQSRDGKGAGDYDVVVIGGGPAGIAAACAARECGRQVLLVDDNPSLGGQIWRGQLPLPSPWAQRCERADLQILPNTCVIAQPEPGVLLAESRLLRYRKLILATGARERFLPFPGWTLPNVTGAGGLQSLVKGGLPIVGKRVVVAGTGPLLVAVARYLRRRGARVVLVAEQTPWRKLIQFFPAVAADPGKLVQSLGLAGHRYLPGCWPIAAEGRDKLDAVVLRRGGKTWREPCDYLACGFGLVPNAELPLLLGCALRQGAVATDEFQETSVPGVYYAGEPGGVDLALAEGEIAGYAAAGRLDDARKFFPARARARRFRAAVDRAFALREELKSLPAADTVVCRCENATFGALQAYPGWRSAKLETRCGMGPCQGRVCGAALEFLRGWTSESVRPPLFPCRLETLLGIIE